MSKFVSCEINYYIYIKEKWNKNNTNFYKVKLNCKNLKLRF